MSTIEIISSSDEEIVIRPGNELSSATYQEFFDVLESLEQTKLPSCITIDLQNTSWIDSMGLGLLYNLYLRWRKSVTRFNIINADNSVMETLRIGHLNHQYTISKRAA